MKSNGMDLYIECFFSFLLFFLVANVEMALQVGINKAQ